MTGKIKTLRSDKKFGFIVGDDSKDYFFHISDCPRGTFDQLTRGQAVEFEPDENERGPRATCIEV